VDTFILLLPSSQKGKDKNCGRTLHLDIDVGTWSEGSTKRDPEPRQKTV